MTGPEHYLRAQDLAAEAASALASGSTVTPAVLAAIGQIHATLALAAATGLRGGGHDEREWLSVARKRATE